MAKATAIPTAQGSPSTPVIIPIGITMGPSSAVVPASDIKLVINPDSPDIPTQRPKPELMPTVLRISRKLLANHKAAPLSLRRAPKVKAPQYMNHASQDIPPKIFFQSVVRNKTGIKSAKSEGPPRPSSSPPTIQRNRIRRSIPNVTYSAYVILPIFLVSSLMAARPGVRSLVLIFLPNSNNM